MKYKIVEREAFKVVGIKREFDCGNMEAGIPGVPAYWGEAQENGTVDQLLQVNNGQIKGLLGITDKYNPEKNAVDYWIATEHNGR